MLQKQNVICLHSEMVIMIHSDICIMIFKMAKKFGQKVKEVDRVATKTKAYLTKSTICNEIASLILWIEIKSMALWKMKW